MLDAPERATLDIVAPGITLSIEQSLAVGKSVAVQSLQSPFTNIDGELAVATKLGGLATDSTGSPLRVHAGGSEVVNVHVDDEVGAGSEVRRPVLLSDEAVLHHQGNSLVNLGDAVEDTVGVLDEPVGTVGGQGVGAGEFIGVVGGLVDVGESETPGVAGLDKEVQDLLDGLVGVCQVGGVEEPVVVAGGLADIQVVHTAREGVEADDDAHVVFLDGVDGDILQVFLLVAMVESRSRDLDPGSVCGRDAEGVDT